MIDYLRVRKILAMSERKAYFNTENVQGVAVRLNTSNAVHEANVIHEVNAGPSPVRHEPRTEIGREALRNFTVDFDAVDRAFTRAMRRNG